MKTKFKDNTKALNTLIEYCKTNHNLSSGYSFKCKETKCKNKKIECDGVTYEFSNESYTVRTHACSNCGVEDPKPFEAIEIHTIYKPTICQE